MTHNQSAQPTEKFLGVQSKEEREAMFGKGAYEWDPSKITDQKVLSDYNVIRSAGIENKNTGMQVATKADEMRAYYGVDDGAGFGIHNGMSPKEICQLADLDWPVLTLDTPPRTTPIPGVIEDPITGKTKREDDPEWRYASGKGKRSIPRTIYRSLGVNPETGIEEKLHFGTVSGNWKPYQNEEVMAACLKFAELGHVNLLRCGSFNEGQTIWVITDVNESFNLGSESDPDDITAKVIISDGRNGKRGFQCRVLVKRTVCANLLVLPVALRSISWNHLSEFNAEMVAARLLEVRTKFGAFERQARTFGRTSIEDARLTHEIRQGFVVDLLGDPNLPWKEQSDLVKSLLDTHKPSIAEAMIMASLRSSGRVDVKLPASEQPAIVQEILDLYKGNATGSHYPHTYGTALQVLNAVTQHTTHNQRYKDANARLESIASSSGSSYTTNHRALETCAFVAQQVAQLNG